MKKEVKTQLTRAKILTAALEDFSKKGYTGFGINDFCKQHGISKGILYHNFASKEALYQACAKESFQMAMAIIKGDSQEIPSYQTYMARRRTFRLEFPYHNHLFLENLVAPPLETSSIVAKERESFDALNRAVFEKLLTEQPLKPSISHEEALAYLGFIQKLFRNYFLNQGLFNLDASKDYEEHIQKSLSLMLCGLFESDMIT